MLNPNAQLDGIRGWGLREVINPENRVLMNGISVFIKEAPEKNPSPFLYVYTQLRVYNLEEGPHLTLLAL